MSELKPSTLAKKLLASETLEAFLARMTLVWQERQAKLATALERAAVASARSAARAKAADPEGFALRRREASRRYEELHRQALRDRDRRMRDRLAPALKAAYAIKQAEKAAQRDADKARQLAERDAKRANRSEGYPKIQTKPHRGRDVAQDAAAVARQGDLSRVWFGTAPVAAARLEKQSSLVSD